jgi:hypothetical protein
MPTRSQAVVITLTILTIASVIALGFTPVHYRVCGHKESLYNEYFPQWWMRRTHCCYAGALVSDLIALSNAQKVFAMDHDGHSAASLDELQWAPRREHYYHLNFRGSSDGNWQCAVEKRPCLPGWYLLTRDGQIHFSEKHPATAQDPVLNSATAIATR